MTTIARMQHMNFGSHFRAYTLRGGEAAEPLDPFLGVDHAWVNAPTFPPHPHAGFSAVSYLFLDSETGIDNRDSLGHRNLIQPGGLHWTTAGRGIVHEEVPAESGKTVHMLQIFINLAQQRQDIAPFALSLASLDVPVVLQAGAKVRVPLGQFGQTRSPLTPPTEVNLFDITLEHDATLAVPVPAGHSAFVMLIHGSVHINGQHFESDDPRVPVFLADEIDEIKLHAAQGNAKLVVFSGAPLRQSVHWRGSLALASPEALASASLAYQRGEFGTI